MSLCEDGLNGRIKGGKITVMVEDIHPVGGGLLVSILIFYSFDFLRIAPVGGEFLVI